MKDHSDWVSNRRKPWARTDFPPYVPLPEKVQLRSERTPETAPKGYVNGRPLHVPYAWNGAERYRQMGIAMSLFTVRQRIRAAQRLMQETVGWAGE